MFLPASLVGPVYEYTDFDAYLHRRGDFKEIPSPAKAVANELGLFVLSVVLYGASSCFGLAYVTEPAFAEDNLAYKLLYIVLCITHI